ncbi:chalcone and stilbene synthase, C-terminal domain protein [Mycobacterium xenopi 3993]|nr:chalcone and stilbene synthase, C-terminal domain protein [Mycobacterium xenopi 3993]
MGWRIGSDGFQIVLSVEVATVTEKYLAEDVRNFLADHGLTIADVSTWVCHPGGPRVIEAVENVLDLPRTRWTIPASRCATTAISRQCRCWTCFAQPWPIRHRQVLSG